MRPFAGLRLALALLAAGAWAPRPVAAESTKTADVSTVVPGGVITWTITFRNELSGIAAVRITDDVPDPSDFLPAEPFDCATDIVSEPPGTTCAYDLDKVTWSNLVLSRNATATIVFRTRVKPDATPGEILCNTAQVDFTAGTSTDRDIAGPTCVNVIAPPENCRNGVDDDIDGFVDCLDTDCFGDPSCNPEDCDNGVDDNGNGQVDCADPGCVSDPACRETVCTDGVDDEGDGLIDCCDSDCAGTPACLAEHRCVDLADDDCDGSTDCLDSDCAGTPDCVPEDCDNGVDDNSDGRTDCQDEDCLGDPDCLGVENCANGTDDDGDAAVDCLDSDCASDPSCVPESDCGDARDNDGDGATDCADSDCRGIPPCPGMELSCENGVDEDFDGLTDCDDPDCVGRPQCVHETICDDGVDDDGDGPVDCLDPDCAGDPACGGEDCGNGTDDDSDGRVDCADSECVMDPRCAFGDYDGDGQPNAADCARMDPGVWAAPIEVERTMTVTKTPGTPVAVIAWPSLAAACGPGTHYDVVAGIVSDLWTDRSVVDGECLAADVSGTTVSDLRLLNEDHDGRYYVVRGRNACGVGPYGSSSLGLQRIVGPADCP